MPNGTIHGRVSGAGALMGGDRNRRGRGDRRFGLKRGVDAVSTPVAMFFAIGFVPGAIFRSTVGDVRAVPAGFNVPVASCVRFHVCSLERLHACSRVNARRRHLVMLHPVPEHDGAVLSRSFASRGPLQTDQRTRLRAGSVVTMEGMSAGSIDRGALGAQNRDASCIRLSVHR